MAISKTHTIISDSFLLESKFKMFLQCFLSKLLKTLLSFTLQHIHITLLEDYPIYTYKI